MVRAMAGIRSIALAFSFGSFAALGACSSGVDDEENPSADAAELSSKTLRLPATGAATFTLKTAHAADVSISIDCRPSSDPDVIGPTFRVGAAALGVPDSTQARAGRWAWAGNLAAGSHAISFTSLGLPASCTVKSGKQSSAATCHTWSSWRSVNTNHTHFRVGTDTSSDWESFPASGNHWGAWAPWSSVYAKPVKRGFLLHNLEHGGVVFSYKCSSPNDSSACKDARDKLIDLANAVGEQRVIITPDPAQPELFAVRAWREAYSSSCLDVDSAKAFASSRIRHGREDIDADPPIPFDPSTTNVPCRDLMAAPDSCN